MHAVVSFFLSLTGTTNIARIQGLTVARRMKFTSVGDPPIEDHASNRVSAGHVDHRAPGPVRWSPASQAMPSKYVSSLTLVDGTCRSSACVAQHRSKAQVGGIALIVRAERVVRSFIHVKIAKDRSDTTISCGQTRLHLSPRRHSIVQNRRAKVVGPTQGRTSSATARSSFSAS